MDSQHGQRDLEETEITVRYDPGETDVETLADYFHEALHHVDYAEVETDV